MPTSAEHDGRLRSREDLTAFDLWIKRMLKERYGRVACEPIPEDLLELLSSQSQDR